MTGQKMLNGELSSLVMQNLILILVGPKDTHGTWLLPHPMKKISLSMPLSLQTEKLLQIESNYSPFW
jgi:hypothetical protein